MTIVSDIGISVMASGGSSWNAAACTPSALTLSVISDTQIDGSFTINGTGQDGHKVYISTDGVTYTLLETLTGADNTFSATLLTAGTLYYFYVVAYKGSQESPVSNIASDWAVIAEVKTLITRFVTPPTAARAALLNTAIKKLIADGVFAKLDALCLIGVDRQVSCQNWIKNAHNATLYNSPVFVSDRYFQGDAISMYIDTNFNPTIGTPKYTRDGASWGMYMVAKETSGTYSGYGVLSLVKGAEGVGWINNAPDGTTVLGAAPWFCQFVRTAANAYRGYKNGVDTDGDVTASVELTNLTFKMFRYESGIYNNSKVAGWFMGGALTPADCANLTAAVEAYMDAIGAGVI